jgi:threonylcarbamoyladenosine tRNA methylthiotransferase MtaB
MGRVYTADEFEKRVQSARRHMPRIALGTDVIVGFPGETEAEFEESITFCKRMQFARMHVFRYSKRPGTPAASASHQVSPVASATRSARMRSLAHDMRMRQMQAFVGLEEDVLVQEPGAAVSGGLFEVVVDHSCSVGEFVRVRFDRIEGDRLVGVRTTASLA